MNPSTLNLSEFRTWDKPRLAQALANGSPLAPGDLAGWQYQGISLGLPRWLERATWSVFVKGFAQQGDSVHGWNVRIEQGDDTLLAPDAPLQPRLRNGKAWTFGHFHVTPLDIWRATSRALRQPCGPGVMLDYGHPRNAMLDPSRAIVDPLVALNPHDPTLLLGVSLFQLGGRAFHTGSWFVLRRWRPVVEVP